MRAEVVLVGARLRMKERYVRRCCCCWCEQQGGVMIRRADEVAAIDEDEEDEEDAAAAPKLGGMRHFVMLGYMLALERRNGNAGLIGP